MDTKQVIKNQIIQEESGRTALIFGIVLDATLSFSEVYPQVFYFLEHLLMNLQFLRKKHTDVDVEYSIVLMHDKAEIWNNLQDKRLTGEREVIDALTHISFYGGSTEGTEKLGDAVCTQLSEMNRCCDRLRKENPNGKVSQQMLLITDACAKAEEQFPDFTKGEQGAYGDVANYGLQQAVVISQGAQYMPMLRIVNRGFSLTENEDGRNRCVFGDLKELLDKNEEETLQASEKLAKQILDIALQR